MRILIANTPQMYRETLAIAIHGHDSNHEVMVAEPMSLDGEAKRFRPQTLVRDDDGVKLDAPDGVVCWIGIMIENHLNARISVNGKVSGLYDISIEDLLVALDETERLLSEDGA